MPNLRPLVQSEKSADARCCSPTCRSRLHRASIGRLRTLKELIRAEERKLRAELFED
jgi:hypothetical protein